VCCSVCCVVRCSVLVQYAHTDMCVVVGVAVCVAVFEQMCAPKHTRCSLYNTQQHTGTRSNMLAQMHTQIYALPPCVRACVHACVRACVRARIVFRCAIVCEYVRMCVCAQARVLWGV